MSRLISGGLWSLAGKLASLPLGLALGAVLARVLPPSELAIYFLASSVVVFGRRLGSMGLAAACTRTIAERLEHDARGAARDVARRGLSVALVGGVAIGGLFWAASGLVADWLEAPELSRVAGWVAALVALESVIFVLTGVFRGHGDIRFATVFDGLAARALLFGTVSVVVLVTQVQVDTVLLLLTATTAVSLTLGLVLLSRAGAREVPMASRASESPAPRVPALLAIGLPMMVSSLSVALRDQFDLWLVGSTRPAGDLAVYGTASRLAALMTVPLHTIASTLPPTIAALNARGHRLELERVLRLGSTVAAVPTAIGVAVVALWGQPLLELVYGAPYGRGAPILTVLSLGWFGATLAGTCGVTLSMTGHQRIVMISALFVVVTTCVAGYLTIEAVGLVGLSAIVASGTTAQALILLFAVRWQLGVWAHVALRPRFTPIG